MPLVFDRSERKRRHHHQVLSSTTATSLLPSKYQADYIDEDLHNPRNDEKHGHQYAENCRVIFVLACAHLKTPNPDVDDFSPDMPGNSQIMWQRRG